MQDEWAGLPWSGEQERARVERAALRVLTCLRGACRRHRRCGARPASNRRCPGDARFPDTDEETAAFKAMVYHWLKRDVAEHDADPHAAAIAHAERWKRIRMREAEALMQIAARLEAEETPDGIFEGTRR
jgi:hypothetical protein